ncbi:PadR family transcriptional regulator [Mobilicoccus pelagius]|uniref:Putative PadR family transcriptional regulator n=1 Tax=Mobilicoccus pelagius NBRC 104925 TaxID=1089455 RepID=H5UME8_9MICO|nr:PadR family transcriptional regulator [Mobilicoccus pelagius]GAB46906.1 putative PadR family transcriptional regulator [Mobilicoccus pelagius NBRC 104925]
MNEVPARWPQAWVRAVLEIALLTVLEDGPAHGYALAEALADRGFGRLRGGSLYPVLARLEEAGDVTTTWEEGAGGPGRRTYAITDTGRARRATELDELAALVQALGDGPGATERSPEPRMKEER